jgi:hypothetical protein
MGANWLVACLVWGLLVGSTQNVGDYPSHSGSTVTRMLARLGLGPEAHLNSDETCEEGKGPCVRGESELLPECWGYESGCGKEKRLFVPQCAGPPKPW